MMNTNTPMIEPVSSGGDKTLEGLIRFYEETLGFCPNSVLTMYHRPAIAYAFIALNKAVMENGGRVTSGLKRLIGYVSSLTAGCRYCQAHTIRAAERYGTRPGQIEHIWEYQHHPAFNEAERVALDLAIAASMVPNQVTPELHQRMQDHWDAGEITEIMGVIALFGYLNRWNDSLATTLEKPARTTAEILLTSGGWSAGKHDAK